MGVVRIDNEEGHWEIGVVRIIKQCDWEIGLDRIDSETRSLGNGWGPDGQ